MTENKFRKFAFSDKLNVQVHGRTVSTIFIVLFLCFQSFLYFCIACCWLQFHMPIVSSTVKVELLKCQFRVEQICIGWVALYLLLEFQEDAYINFYLLKRLDILYDCRLHSKLVWSWTWSTIWGKRPGKAIGIWHTLTDFKFPSSASRWISEVGIGDAAQRTQFTFLSCTSQEGCNCHLLQMQGYFLWPLIIFKYVTLASCSTQKSHSH